MFTHKEEGRKMFSSDILARQNNLYKRKVARN